MFHWSILLSLVACAQKGPPPQETGQPTETGSVPDDTASGDTVPDDTATETEPPDDDHDGYAVVDGDCDDTDRQVNPGESELCGNAVDDDCDGTADGGCGPISSVTDLTVFSGGTRGYTRRGLSGAGDMDADGFDDVVIGAYCDSEVDVCAGAAFLVFGSAEPHSVHLEHALKLTGEFGYDYAGWAVAGVGDTDADGYDDVLVGAPESFDGAPYGGAVYLLSGGAGLKGGSLGSALELTGASGDYAGSDVAAAGDVNADGFADAIVGAYGNCSRTYLGGAAYLLLGGDSTGSGRLVDHAVTYAGTNPMAYMAAVVGEGGDVNGDGFDDLLVGGDMTETVFLVTGSATPSDADLEDTIAFEGAGEGLGVGVAGGGDVNADGYADILLAAEDNRDSAYYAGATFLILGSPAIEAADLGTAVRYLGVQESDQAGVSAGVGDLDADGFADFVVTGRGNDDAGPEAGAAYLVFGEAVPPGGLLSEWPTWQGVEDDALGPPRAGGDIDADGVPDILLGTDRDDGGRSYVLFGADALTAAGR